MKTYKNHARLSGIFFLTAFVGGIIGFSFLGAAIETPLDLNEVADNDTQIIIGAVGILLMAFSTASIAIPLYPVLKKKNEGVALASVVFRTIESVGYVIVAISIMVMVKLSHLFEDAGSPTNDTSYQRIGEILQELFKTDFGIPFFVIGAFMYYFLFYQTRLIPRWLSVWGIFGILCNFLNVFLKLFSVYDEESMIATLSELPLAANELVLAVWLILKGFNINALEELESATKPSIS